METSRTIKVNTLLRWLNTGKKVSIVDIRPINERSEWYIPGSIHIDAYGKLKSNRSDALDELNLEKDVPVITVCAGGKTSLIAAELLRNKGYEAYSLENGMRGWSVSWNTARLSFPDFEIIQVRRTGKGCLSYIISSKGEAIVVDASVSEDVYEEILRENDLSLKGVIETHIHADHLSRSKPLAEGNSVGLYLPIPNKVNFHFTEVKDDSVIRVGNIDIRAIRTPGHTMESTCYLINDRVLLTGDTLFTNGVGRPDLKANPAEAADRSKLLYDSLQTLMKMDDNVIVLPGHTSSPVSFDSVPLQTTIGQIRKDIPMLHLEENEFVNTILQRIPETPPNFLSIVERNLQGNFNDINPTDLEAGANKCAIT